jgi:hypothetical protein
MGFLTKKIDIKLSKIWVWYPEFEIRDQEKSIPDPGSRIIKAPDPDPQHCIFIIVRLP